MRIELFNAMCARNGYNVTECALEIRHMCWQIDFGSDPEELLQEQGLEADYVPHLLEYYSDYIDEQEERKGFED